MTTVDMPCRRGCVRAGTEDNPQILPARHGAYCSRCWGRIDQALLQAPELAQHILSNLTSISAATDEQVDVSKDAPLPFNQAAFDDVSELYSALVYWSRIWAEYLDVHPPAAARRAWRRRSGTVTGLPTGTTPERGHTEVLYMTRWLRDRLDTILELAPEDVDEFDDAIRDVWRMNARWPRLEGPKYAAVPCPVMDCGKRMAVYPPAFAGDARRIVCDGGHFHPEEEYDHLLAVIEQNRVELAREARRQQAQRARAELSDESRAEQVKAHLIAKYLHGAGALQINDTQEER